jgi:hypothetical protein
MYLRLEPSAGFAPCLKLMISLANSSFSSSRRFLIGSFMVVDDVIGLGVGMGV